MGKSNHQGEACSCWVGTASGSLLRGQEPGLRMVKLRQPFRSEHGRSYKDSQQPVEVVSNAIG
jgi:hypothetical protein